MLRSRLSPSVRSLRNLKLHFCGCRPRDGVPCRTVKALSSEYVSPVELVTVIWTGPAPRAGITA
jgi:hypothetical protein